jgi:hypothetical protein
VLVVLILLIGVGISKIIIMYLEDFIEKNKRKPFVTNLKKYNSLNFFGRAKIVSSFLTNLFIDAEGNIENSDLVANEKLQKELVMILNNIILFKNDEFLSWLGGKLS